MPWNFMHHPGLDCHLGGSVSKIKTLEQDWTATICRVGLRICRCSSRGQLHWGWKLCSALTSKLTVQALFTPLVCFHHTSVRECHSASTTHKTCVVSWVPY